MQVAGAEVLVMETIRRLAGSIEPVVFCLDAVGPLGERLRAEGVEVLCFNRRPGRDFGVAWRMARAIRTRRIEVLHAHQYTPFFYAALARVLGGGTPRLILTEHGRHFPDTASSLRRWMNRLVFDRLADAVNACCAFSGQALAQVDGFSARRIEVIENGIEVDRYGAATDRAALRSSLGLDSGRQYVITVARFHLIKDHATLLRAFAVVAAAKPDVDLLLVGDGQLRSDLEQQTKSLGLDNRVRFLGVRSDIPALLQAADVFAMTSLCEAASLTVLEAMASRLPVVVTAVGGNPEMVRDGKEGLLVPRGDVACTATALLHLLDNPEVGTALGASGRAHVEERYRLSQTVENYWRLYRRVCGRRS
jgi:glycosyltransferase involved in cell wall biosynthesis